MLRILLRFCFLFVCSCVAALCSAQTTLVVGPGQPYTTVQAGIDAANDGDTVLVAPGTYAENIDFKGKAITVTSSGGAAATILNGSKQAATVTFAHNETRRSVLSDFTITGGGDGTAYPSEGGVSILLASPSIIGNTITGAGCYGIGSQAGAPLIQGNTISHTHVNAATGACGDGNGSGIWLTGLSNPYGDYPPLPALSPQVLNNVIELNTESATLPSDEAGGAGIAVRRDTDPLIAYNTIRNNSVILPGVNGGGGGGILVFAAGATIVNNLIYGNTAVNGGGGVSVSNFGSPYTVTLINNTLSENGLQPNGGIFTGGEQLYFGGSSAVDLENNLMLGNSSVPTMVCFEVPRATDPSAALPVTFLSNDVFNLDGPATGGFNGSTCGYPLDSGGNLSLDPLFVNHTGADYHLLQGSPAIDAGSNSAVPLAVGLNFTTDLDGNQRIQDATGKGCLIDMGAYEFPGTSSVCGIALTLTSSLDPSAFGQEVTFTAQLASTTAAGTMQFSDGATVLGTEAVSGTGLASLTTSGLAVGSHSIHAAFQPSDQTSAAANASLTQVVTGYATALQLSSSANPSSFGQSVTFTATSSSQNGTPTGTVTFADGGVVLGTAALSAGVAAYGTSALATGTHQITATLNSDGAFATSTAALSERVGPRSTSTRVAAEPNPVTTGALLTLTGEVTPTSGVLSGTISFSANGVDLGSAPLGSDGRAALQVPAPVPGYYRIVATYSGDVNDAPSTSLALSETVLGFVTTTDLTASPNPAAQGQPVTLSAKITGVDGQNVTGNVAFLDGGRVLGLSGLSTSGTASFSTSTLSPGLHSLTASYEAAGLYAGSTSPAVQEQIVASTFAIALTPAAMTLRPGEPGTVQVNLTSMGGFEGPLTLSVGSLPTYATGTISPATVSLAAGGSGSATLLLNAATAQDRSLSLGSKRPVMAFAVFACLLMRLSRGRRRPLRNLLGLSLLAILTTTLSGCGTLGVPYHIATPGVYRIPVTAIDSHQGSHSATLTLTVSP